VRASYSAVGPIEVVYDQQNPADRHLIWPTTRPPEVEDFRFVHGKHLARANVMPDWRAIIVGPHAALEPDRQDRLAWLRNVSHCLSFDEGDLRGFARRLAARFKP
jgi:hypothetical protein